MDKSKIIQAITCLLCILSSVITAQDTSANVTCTNLGYECKFPFVYHGDEYTNCIPGIRGMWCGIKQEVSESSLGVDYDYCIDQCPTDKCTDKGYKCIFPFEFDGKNYTSCISYQKFTGTYSWCPIVADYQSRGEGIDWGYCSHICPEGGPTIMTMPTTTTTTASTIPATITTKLMPQPSPTPQKSTTTTPMEIATPSAMEVVTPSGTPVEVVTPSSTPVKVVTPSATPKVVTPSAKPVVVVTPSAKPVEVASPSAKPVEVASPSAKPVATPVEVDTPSATPPTPSRIKTSDSGNTLFPTTTTAKLPLAASANNANAANIIPTASVKNVSVPTKTNTAGMTVTQPRDPRINKPASDSVGITTESNADSVQDTNSPDDSTSSVRTSVVLIAIAASAALVAAIITLMCVVKTRRLRKTRKDSVEKGDEVEIPLTETKLENKREDSCEERNNSEENDTLLGKTEDKSTPVVKCVTSSDSGFGSHSDFQHS